MRITYDQLLLLAKTPDCWICNSVVNLAMPRVGYKMFDIPLDQIDQGMEEHVKQKIGDFQKEN